MNFFKLNFLILFLFLTTHLFSQLTTPSYVESEQGTLFLNGSKISTGSALLGAFDFTSDHAARNQIILRRSNGGLIGRVFGNGTSFGLFNGNDWVVRSERNVDLSLRVANETILKCYAGGKVSIGDIADLPGDYQLYVKGGILAEKVRVALEGENDWADFVFEDDYKLMPLNEVKSFIEDNDHLPNVPSADEMVESGLDVLESDAILLRKIEEAYLYILQQEERITQLEAKLKN